MKKKTTNPIFILCLLALLIKIGFGVFPSFSTPNHKSSDVIILVEQESELASELNVQEQKFEVVNFQAFQTSGVIQKSIFTHTCTKSGIQPSVKIYLLTHKFII